jgi:hypothetical protein
MTSSPPGPDRDGRAGMPAQARTVAASGLIVEDQRARRIRRPVDLLRCLLAVLGIVLAVGIGLLAGATARGVQIDAVGASSRLPHPVLALLGVAATLALLLWPAALAIRQLTRRQPRRLAEAVLTGGATIALVALANTAPPRRSTTRSPSSARAPRDRSTATWPAWPPTPRSSA